MRGGSGFVAEIVAVVAAAGGDTADAVGIAELAASAAG